ncbi:pyroglutamyl-peptidase I [Deinococcus peraridilitoris]|uniref:Pyroglutamyl-peptidase I n=1 Tax=Deinococcus peraridilitoris (strain DSM 19664 / LMG 22246 / CIP 109416 / KR-200) TaxID=937777 RepID=K9ZW84_DEIPD|nr:pyroglutamyl-peptidase I [Deinococcus peraridilitoris]AFZ65831.1 pyroglutamyl peptidase I [Deinococcus peraridilitoris DSM 19664]
MMKLLLTGFEPFGGDTVNPSEQVVEALGNQVVSGVQVRGELLPVDTGRAPQVLRAALERHQPDAVVLTGLAAGRPQLTLERVAVNVLDFRIPDNAGVQKHDERIEPAGPDAYLSSLPLGDILRAWKAAGIPGYVSDTAGLYLCNQVMYVARHALGAEVPCGFLHLPANPEVALGAPRELPYLPQQELNRGVQVVVETVAARLRARTATETEGVTGL